MRVTLTGSDLRVEDVVAVARRSALYPAPGIMVDVGGLANPGAVDAGDFLFTYGNDDTPGRIEAHLACLQKRIVKSRPQAVHRACLNSQHLAGQRLPVVLHQVGDRLKHLHLGDTPGPVEADLPPGWHHDFTAFMTAIDEIGYEGAMSLDMYGGVDEGVVGSEEASAYGYATMKEAAARARGQR